MPAAPKLEYYEEVYYAYQVEGRGLLDSLALEQNFRQRLRHYDELFAPLLPADRQMPCLDLACGYGNWLYYLRARGFANCRGIDLDDNQVALARDLGLNVEVGDVREALDVTEHHGLISAFDLIEHLDKNDAVRLLQACRTALRPNGMLILQCPCADGFTGCHDLCNDLTHRWAPSSNMLRQLLMTVGFNRVSLLDLSLPPYPQGLRRRMLMGTRRVLRRVAGVGLRALGINPPRIWSNSVVAVAWK